MTRLNTLTKALLGATAMTALTMGTAHAAGTDAGTNVQNTFTLDYEVGGVDQPDIDNTASPTEFTVDRKIDLTVASTGNQVVAPGAQDQQLVFTVTNTGNDNQGYSLASPVNEGSDDFDATFGAANKVYVFPADAGGTCTLTGKLIAANEYTSGATADVAPDDALCVVIQGDIPIAPVDGNQSDVSLVADTVQPTAYINSAAGAPGTAEVADVDGTNTLTGGAENVLADGTGTSNEVANAGDHSATATYIVASADLAASKSVNVISTDGSSCALSDIGTSPAAATTTEYSTPGACVEYTIEVINSGSVAADFIDIADTVSSDLENVVAKSAIFVDTDGTNTLGVATVGNQVDLTNGKLAAGQTGYLLIRANVK